MTHPMLPVQDELEIRNLVGRYPHYADAGLLDEFASLFTPDATWTRENSPPASEGGSGLPPETVRGHDGLKQMIENSIIKRFNRKFRHQMTDLVVEATDNPDEAKGICRALITDWRDGPGKIAMCALYTMRYRRTENGWLFAAISVAVLPE